MWKIIIWNLTCRLIWKILISTRFWKTFENAKYTLATILIRCFRSYIVPVFKVHRENSHWSQIRERSVERSIMSVFQVIHCSGYLKCIVHRGNHFGNPQLIVDSRNDYHLLYIHTHTHIYIYTHSVIFIYTLHIQKKIWKKQLCW